MIVFLTGFMGSGKTTVGKKLATRLGYTFIDMDQFIEQTHNQTITEIFTQQGESAFREMEHQALKVLSEKENSVIATGGGAPCYFNNMETMNKAGQTVYLKISPRVFASRVYNPKTERPLLKGKSHDELEIYAAEMLNKRAPFYEMAKITINAMDGSAAQIASTLQAQLNL